MDVSPDRGSHRVRSGRRRCCTARWRVVVLQGLGRPRRLGTAGRPCTSNELRSTRRPHTCRTPVAEHQPHSTTVLRREKFPERKVLEGSRALCGAVLDVPSIHKRPDCQGKETDLFSRGLIGQYEGCVLIEGRCGASCGNRMWSDQREGTNLQMQLFGKLYKMFTVVWKWTCLQFKQHHQSIHILDHSQPDIYLSKDWPFTQGGVASFSYPSRICISPLTAHMTQSGHSKTGTNHGPVFSDVFPACVVCSPPVLGAHLNRHQSLMQIRRRFAFMGPALQGSWLVVGLVVTGPVLRQLTVTSGGIKTRTWTETPRRRSPGSVANSPPEL